MESLLISLLEKGGPLGVLASIVFVLVIVGVWLRQKGILSVGDKTKIVDKDRLVSMDRKLGSIDRRLTDVENDLKNRPTKQELHELELSMTKMDGRLQGLERVTTATNHAVNRIEEHMLKGAGK